MDDKVFKKADTALEAYKLSGEMLTRHYHNWDYYIYTHRDDPYPKERRDRIEDARSKYGETIVTVIAGGRSNEDAICAADIAHGDVLLNLWNDFVSCAEAAEAHNKMVMKAEAARRKAAQQAKAEDKSADKPNGGFKAEVDDRVPVWFGVSAISLCLIAVMFLVKAAA